MSRETMTEFQDPFSEEIWRSTYKHHTDKDINDTFRRVARAIADAEETEELKAEWAEKFYDMFTGFKVVPGGRILSNAGTGWSGTTMINCFVSPRSSSGVDSLEGIIANLRNQSMTLKAEGGWGENFSMLRPRGSMIHGIGVESPGAVKYMELFDKSSEIVTSGSGTKSKNAKAKGKIRKGAMMAVMDITSPDIVEFITAKQQSGRLTKFNMSVNCIDEFMNKVIEVERLRSVGASKEEIEKADKWNLRFPDTAFERYDSEWDGFLANWEKKGYPVIVHRTVSATWLWDLIMKSTYARNEPGVLFLDKANYFNPLNYKETIQASNPCVTGDTLILTKNGYTRIDELVDQPVEVWNGYEWSKVVPTITGLNRKVSKVTFSDGSELTCTDNHKFVLASGDRVELKSLSIGDKLMKWGFPTIEGTQILNQRRAYTQGFYSGDGSTGSNEIWLYGKKKLLKDDLDSIHYWEDKTNGDRSCLKIPKDYFEKTFVPDASYTVGTRLAWLAGLIDSDGTRSCKEGGFSIWSVDKKFLKEVKLMLNTLGVQGTISLGHGAQDRQMPNGKGGTSTYQVQDCWRITVSPYNGHLLEQIGLTTRRVDISSKPQRNASRFISVTSVTPENEVDKVYCFTEPKNHTGCFNGIVTGQCGEQMLAPGGICNLGSINLTQFVNEGKTGFDIGKLEKYTRYLVRFLDNVNTISKTPLPEYDYSMKNKRRIGCGILGWGSSLYMMKIKIGSQAANDLRNEVMRTIARSTYKASIDLAKEKGMFSECDPYLHVQSPFIKKLNLPDDCLENLLKYGIRNSSLLSIQPTGNTSVMSNITSGGLEPIFLPEYTRTVIVPFMPEHIADVTPKWYEGEWHETEMFKFHKEGDEQILKGKDKFGVVYKVDKNRGLTKEVLCQDYGVRYLSNLGEWDPDAEWAVTTDNLTADDHINDLIGFSNYLDSACSKTINLPFDYPFEDFKDIYLKAYKSGVVRGVTTYRSGTMTTVLSARDEKTATCEDEEIILEDVKLADTLPATVQKLKAEGRRWYLTVIHDPSHKRPVALFVQTNHSEKNATTNDAVDRLISLAYKKGIPERHVDDIVEKMKHDSNTTKLARVTSLLLRHGVLIKNIVAVIDSVENMYAGQFLFALRKFLASYIKDGEKATGVSCQNCGSDQIVYSEGCFKCLQCSASKCG